MADGLPEMRLECLYEDRQGRLWASTHERGAVAFDGVHFHPCLPEDGLASHGVFSITEDPDGGIWFNCHQGLTRRQEGHLERMQPDPPQPCTFLWASLRNRKED